MLRRHLICAAVLGSVVSQAGCALDGDEAAQLADADGADETAAGLTIDPPTSAMRWKRWQVALQSSRNYSNPYSGVTVDVTLTGPDGTTRTTQAFWDGDRTYRIRYMFPTTGRWTWRTTASDRTNPGLHDHQGTVQVANYIGLANPLYQKGYLKTTRHVLTYGDGTPFLWMGDTAWSALIAASQPEWESYVDRRKALGFNVIQIHTGTGWVKRTTDRDHNAAPWLGSGTTLRWNPTYWQGVEDKVQYANDHGVLVLFTAIRQPGPGFPTTSTAEVERFSRLFAARFQGNFVVYSPVADDVWTPQADASGNALAAAASQQLVTAHPRFKWDPASIFHDKPYTDFGGLQSGAGWQHDPYPEFRDPPRPFSAALASRQAIEWPETLYARNTKPVLALEVPYDAKAMQDGSRPDLYGPPYPARMVRSGAWLAMLSGAKGVTYGCSDIWSWGIPQRWDGPDWTFEQAMSQDSAHQMKLLFDFFSQINWASLAPRRGAVRNQSPDWLKKIVLSIGSGGSLGVAYLPDNPSITLDMTAFSGSMRVTWFHPVTGARVPQGTVTNQGVQTLSKPNRWGDAVLLLQRV